MSTLRDETLSDLLAAFWQARVFLMFGAIIGFIIAALIIIFSVPHMRAIMIVAPTSENSISSLPMYEQTNSTEESLPFLRYLKILTGPKVVRAVMEKNPQIKPALENSPRFKFEGKKSFRTAEDIAAYLSRQVLVKPVGDTSLRTIELEHANPLMARNLLMQLHEAADSILRLELLARTENRLSYLEDTISTTANPEHRQALTNLLIEQERQVMMVRMDKYFAAALVEPPYIHPKPVWPRKSYIFPLCVLMGLLVGWVIFGVVKSYEPDPS